MYIRFMFEAGVKNLISTLRCYCCSFYRPLGTKLRLGWSSQFNVGRLFRFWDPSKIKKDGEFMGITLFLLYEKIHSSLLVLAITTVHLHTYFLNSNGKRPAQIVGVLQQNGWSFVSCTRCGMKLHRSGTYLRCNRCVSPNVTGGMRFCVEFAVDNDNDSATFVVFDREETKLTKQDASTLALKGALSCVFSLSFGLMFVLVRELGELCHFSMIFVMLMSEPRFTWSSVSSLVSVSQEVRL
ncbi:unnamed protein product, partial [Brassica rapa]